jgi:RHS repeat-associated protein
MTCRLLTDERYYSFNWGRFQTPDPSGLDAVDLNDPGTWNIYAYANDDPINFNDPAGLDVSVPTYPGGDPNSCLNQKLIPWMHQTGYGFTTGDNLGNFFNTYTGVLGLTLYFESATGSPTLYTDIAQVMLNIYQLRSSNTALDSSLHLATGGFISVVKTASIVWSGGNLTANQYSNLDNVLDGSIIGRQAATNASACDQLMSAFNVSQTAQGYLNGSQGVLPGATVSAQTYWFYKAGDNDPVQHQYWNTTTSPPLGGFLFETLLGPARRPVRPPRPPRRPRRGVPQSVGGF